MTVPHPVAAVAVEGVALELRVLVDSGDSRVAELLRHRCARGDERERD